ncbi:hypothetical protein Tco_1025221 [Tanacetum coccineum]
MEPEKSVDEASVGLLQESDRGHRFIELQSGIRAQVWSSTIAKDGRVKIECFDGRNFGFWKMGIEDYMYQKKLHQPLSETKPSGMKEED